MTGLVTRVAKGSPLTFAEMDENIVELGQVALAYSNFGNGLLASTLFDQYIVPFPIRLTRIMFRASISVPIDITVGMNDVTQLLSFAVTNTTYDVTVNKSLAAFQRITFTTGLVVGDLKDLSITLIGTK